MRAIRPSTAALALALSHVLGCASEPTVDKDEAVSSPLELTSNGLSATLTLSSDWGAGYCADVVLTNTSGASVATWSVTIELGGATLSSLWSATSTASGTKIAVTPAAFNGGLAASATAVFGFCANGAARPTIAALATSGSTGVGGAPTAGGTTAKGGSSSVGGTTAKGGSSSAGGTTATTQAALTVYIAGDSTVASYTDTSSTKDQAGWGQMLPEIFTSKVTVVNRAAGGRTALWFALEGGVDKILSTLKSGDYFLIQFGTNDQNTTATFTVGGVTYPRYADASTTFKTQLKQYYLDPIRAKKAIPVLVTPPPRNSAYCKGGNGLSAYANAMIELGRAENVAVATLNAKTYNYLKALCPKPTTAAEETFFFGKADGTIDGTHFQENGARKMAGFIGASMTEIALPLSQYLR